MESKLAFIYCLFGDGNRLYIGQTVQWRGRIARHRREKAWVKSQFLLEIVTFAERIEAEKRYISLFKSLGYGLVNKNDGGGGGMGYWKGLHHSPETCTKISAVLTGRPGRPAWNKGIPQTEEHRRRFTMQGMKHSVTTRAKISASHIGIGLNVPLSSEHRQKIADGCRKYWNERTAQKEGVA